MKKELLLLVGGLVLLVGCSFTDDSATIATSTESSTIESTVDSGGEEMSDLTTVFTGTIQREDDSIIEPEGETMLIFLTDVEAVEDPENIVPTFVEMGVGIHVNSETTDDWQEWTNGRKVQVTLEGLPITTMSIPPQIPGMSVKKVELIP